MIYVDSCIVIYAVEDDGARGDAVRRALADAGSETVAISPLVTLECLVAPLRDEDLSLHDHYVRALDNFLRVPLGEEQFVRAAQLRARYRLRTPDALHLAAAQMSGCDRFWTNDRRLAEAAGGVAMETPNVV